MANISLVSQHEVSVKNQNHYHNILVSDINSKIANTVPSNAKITKVVLRVNTKVSSSLPMCELYCYLGNNAGTSSNNTNLGKMSGDLPTSAKDYDWDLTSYFNSAGHNTHPFTMNTSSTYLIPFWLNDYIFSFKITCKVDLVVDYETPVTVTATVSPEGAGRVTGCGSYWQTDNATLKAIENEGHKFKHWLLSADGTTSENGNNPLVTEAGLLSRINIVAVFEKISYTVKFVNYDGTVLQTSTVEHGSKPSYTKATPTKPATAQYTYTFSGWSPTISAATANATYTAQFTATTNKYKITTAVSPTGGGTVTGGGTYNYGTKPTLTATPATGYKFVKWSDGVTTASRTVTVTGNATYTAEFALDKINQLYNGDSLVKGLYTDGKNIVFVVDGTVTPATGSIFDTVDGYHIKVQNTVPSGMVEGAGYIGTTKIYG